MMMQQRRITSMHEPEAEAMSSTGMVTSGAGANGGGDGGGGGDAGGGGGDGATKTASGAAMTLWTIVVTPSPSAANCVLTAVWRDVASARTPVDIPVAAEEAPDHVSKKMSAVTITEPAVRLRRTALVLTPASFASTVRMDICAAKL